jgi:citrate lyase subunit beta/citryl-CoA lyase
MREVEQARELVAAYEAQKGRAPSQAWIDAPERNNAARLLARHAAIETFGDVAAR